MTEIQNSVAATGTVSRGLVRYVKRKTIEDNRKRMKLLSCLSNCAHTLFVNEMQAFETDMQDFETSMSEILTNPRNSASELYLCLAEVLIEVKKIDNWIKHLSYRIQVFNDVQLHNPGRLAAINRFVAELISAKRYNQACHHLNVYLQPAEDSLWRAWRKGDDEDNSGELYQLNRMKKFFNNL